METEVVITVFLLVICGYFKAVSDSLLFRTKGLHHTFYTKIFGDTWFAQNSDTWKNKWKAGDKSKGERFFLSSTALVFVTDAWHFFQFLQHLCIFNIIAIWVTPQLYDVVIWWEYAIEHFTVMMLCMGIHNIIFEQFFKITDD